MEEENTKCTTCTVFSTEHAFAAADGSITAWGHSWGGSAGEVHNVRTVFSNKYAFAALHVDGSITAWVIQGLEEPRAMCTTCTVFPIDTPSPRCILAGRQVGTVSRAVTHLLVLTGVQLVANMEGSPLLHSAQGDLRGSERMVASLQSIAACIAGTYGDCQVCPAEKVQPLVDQTSCLLCPRDRVAGSMAPTLA